MKLTSPKLTLIGAGSLFFGRQAIWQMVTSPYLNSGTLALVDTDAKVLQKMMKIAKMVAESQNVKLNIIGSVNAQDVLKDSDFVVLSFADESIKYRDIDCKISAKYGVRMCSGDTIGPGGIFRSMRELPIIMDYVQKIRQLCPDAWVINYINPTSVNGIALMRYAPDLKTFALCDAQYMPHIKIGYAKRAGIISESTEFTEQIDKDFDMRIAGVNHFTWMLKAEYQGKDVTKEIAKSISKYSAKETEGGDTGAKAIFNESIGYELYKIFGYIPTVVGHTKEYVRFWQGKGVIPSKIPTLSLWDAEDRYARRNGMFEQLDKFIDKSLPISQFMTAFNKDPATDIIESIVTDSNKRFYVNVPNNNCVTNMSKDAFLELLCTVGKDGPVPLPVGDMPRGIRGMQEVVLDTHELTCQAIIEKSQELLRRAMLTDPLICSIEDADAIIKELLEAQKQRIPAQWYKYS